MSTFYNEIPGDLFQDNLSQRVDMLDKLQAELRQASAIIITRMTKVIAVELNRIMSSYVDEVLAYRKMNFIDMISIKRQSLNYEEIQIGLKEELDSQIYDQILALTLSEWLVFQFRDTELYYRQGKNAVIASIKTDMIKEFDVFLEEHLHTKRMQRLLERYPWLMR